VAIAAVGAQPWTAFAGQEAGLAVILRNLTGAAWPAVIISLGAVISIFSVTLIIIYGQTRILFAMSRDGLLPRIFQTVNPKTKVPTYNTMIVSFVIALMAAFVPLDVLTNLTSLGTLAAFAIVSLGVIVLRRTRPDLPRAYRTPLYPVLPACSVLFCLYLIVALPWVTHIMFMVWLSAAGVFYFGYSVRRSALALALKA
jgi:basic amino acid/polyamine antiporter, APA family